MLSLNLVYGFWFLVRIIVSHFLCGALDVGFLILQYHPANITSTHRLSANGVHACRRVVYLTLGSIVDFILLHQGVLELLSGLVVGHKRLSQLEDLIF